MANTYNWTINALDGIVSVEDGNENVIYSVQWQLDAVDSSEEHTVSATGDHQVEYDANNFTPYENLTKADVVQWLEAGLDVDNIKADLDSKLQTLSAPTKITFTDPFAPGAL